MVSAIAEKVSPAPRQSFRTFHARVKSPPMRAGSPNRTASIPKLRPTTSHADTIQKQKDRPWECWKLLANSDIMIHNYPLGWCCPSMKITLLFVVAPRLQRKSLPLKALWWAEIWTKSPWTWWTPSGGEMFHEMLKPRLTASPPGHERPVDLHSRIDNWQQVPCTYI